MLAVDYALKPVLAALKAQEVLHGVFAVDKQIAYATESDPARLEPVLEQRLENALKPSTWPLATAAADRPAVAQRAPGERPLEHLIRPPPAHARRGPIAQRTHDDLTVPSTARQVRHPQRQRRAPCAPSLCVVDWRPCWWRPCPIGVQADEKSANTLRIGYQKYGTLVLLKARGTLEKRLAEDGVKVQWTEFPGGPQLLEGLNVGSIDFGVTGETPPVFAQAAGADLLYVAYEPPAPTSEAILLPKDSPIRSVAEAEGQESRPEQGLQRALPVGPRPRAGRPEVQRHPTRLPAAGRRPRRLRASQRRRLGDLGPYQAAAEKQLSARVLVDGRELVDNHQFYLATRTYAQRHPQVLDKLVDEIREVGDWSRANPQQVTEQVAPLLGLPADITLTAVKRQGYGAQLITPAVVEAQQKIADTFTQLKLIPKPLSIKDVIWTPPAGKVASAP